MAFNSIFHSPSEGISLSVLGEFKGHNLVFIVGLMTNRLIHWFIHSSYFYGFGLMDVMSLVPKGQYQAKLSFEHNVVIDLVSLRLIS